jgi:hypothetical protein
MACVLHLAVMQVRYLSIRQTIWQHVIKALVEKNHLPANIFDDVIR